MTGSAAGESRSDQDDDEPHKRPQRRDTRPARSGGSALLREIAVVLVISLGLSYVLKTFLVQAFFIPSPSMTQTLLVGDRILVEKLTPGLRDLRRGDVVVFRDPGGWLEDVVPEEAGVVRRGLEFVGLVPADTGHDLVKRVVGMGGDRVVCCDGEGRLTVNGVAQPEPYLEPGDAPSELPFDIQVPPGRLWVMGDNRSGSNDSRAHLGEPGGGFVPVASVVGRAVVVVWPLGHAGSVALTGQLTGQLPDEPTAGGPPRR